MNLTKMALWLFFAFYLVLPEYFALELSASFPLLTASRIIILFLFACVFIKRNIRIHIDKSFLFYFILLSLIDIYHITTNEKEAIKALFSLIFEEMVLYIVLQNLITSKLTIIKGLDIIVKMSGIISLLGIFEAFTGTNVFYFLTTTSREMLQTSYERLGVLRAETSFGHPVYFAVYLVCIFPFTLYFFENTNNKKYLFIAVLNITALFCSGTRGGIFVLVVLILYYIFMKRDVFKKKYLKFLIGIFPVLIVVFILFPQLFNYVSNLIISLLNSLGLTTSEAVDFGNNSSGMSSRWTQFTGLIWAKEHNALLLGFGPGAHKNGLISYKNEISGRWNVIHSIDIGYVGHILLYGIIGAIGYAVLYISAGRIAWKNSNEKDTKNLFNAFKCFYLAYFVSLTSSVGSQDLFIVITILMLIYREFDKKEKRNLLQ